MAEKFDPDRIKDSVPLADYIQGRGIQLKRDGREFKACCPFHRETTPSFTVFPSREGYQKYHCFGCSVGGNIIDFVMEYDRVDFPEACEILGGKRQAPDVDRTPAPAREITDPYKGYTVLTPPADAPAIVAGERTPRLRNPKKESEGRPFTSYIPDRVHDYREADGTLIGRVLRVPIETAKGPDKITPLLLWCRAPDGTEGWTHHPMPNPRSLYRREAIEKHPGMQWLVVEGEKCADVAAATLRGLVAVSWQGGGKAYAKTDWSPVAGRSVVCWMDNDDEGERTMLGHWKDDAWVPGIVEIQIEAGAQSVKVIGRDPDKPKGWDVADAVETDGWTPEQVLAYAKEKAAPWTMDEIRARRTATKPASKPKPKPVPQMKVVATGQAVVRPHLAPPERIVTPGEIPQISRYTAYSAIDDVAEASFESRLLRKQDAEGNDKGIDRKSLHNHIVVLRYHPAMAGVLAWDEFSAEVVFRKCPPWERANPSWAPCAMIDNDARLCAAWMETERYQIKPNEAGAAMQTVAIASTFNPVRSWLESLKWDGVCRVQGEANLDPWLTEYMGAKNIPINRAFGMRWLIAAIARAFQAGAKVDTMLILEGSQGARKSSALQILGTIQGKSYYSANVTDVGSKDAAIAMNGVWIGEMAELEAMRGKEASQIKAWLTSATDRFRPPYGKIAVNLPRRAVLAGTVNPQGLGYLKDPTGGRRFWPVRVHGKIDLDRLRADQEQIWAEAVHLYKQGAQWWLTDDEEKLAAIVQKQRQEQEPWGPQIDEFVRTMEHVTISDVMKLGLELNSAQHTYAHQTRVAEYLKSEGWVRTQARIGGIVKKCWARATATDPSDD